MAFRRHRLRTLGAAWNFLRHRNKQRLLETFESISELSQAELSQLAPPPRHRAAGAGSYLRLLRPSHWVKNILVFVPVLTSHRWSEGTILLDGFLAFAILCLAASAVYAANDVLDIVDDRQHPSKTKRPVAAGEISIPQAIISSGLLLVSAALLSLWLLPPLFLFGLIIYWLLGAGYLLVWKKRLGFDLLILVAMHLVRIILGGLATGIGCSGWLLAFSVTFLAGLAMLKRYAELCLGNFTFDETLPGRAYLLTHREPIQYCGWLLSATSIGLILVYAFSPQAQLLYQHPVWLLGAALSLGLWERLMWRKASQGRLAGDPIQMAFRFPWSYACAVALLVFIWFAIL